MYVYWLKWCLNLCGGNLVRSRIKFKSEFKDFEVFNKFYESDKYDIRYVSVFIEKLVEIYYKY